jgi:hypothetical protein
MSLMTTRSGPSAGRRTRLVLFALAAVGLAIGLDNLRLHLMTDPLADVHAYYDAANRLNNGQNLYDQPSGTTDADFYRYPPLLAIAFRPLALLPFDAAAVIWEAIVIGALVYTLWRLGNRPSTWLAVGLLALPIAWAAAVGQAQILVTALLLGATPFGVALATHLKLFPALVALYWLGRRDWRALGRFGLWAAALGVLQVLLEPGASLAYLSFPNLSQVGQVNNFSPFALSPLAWLALIVAGAIVTIRLAPTRWGWAAAVAFSVLATPRLLTYQLSTLLAALAPPRGDPASQEVPAQRGSQGEVSRHQPSAATE